MACVYPSKDQISRRRRPISNEASHRRQERGHESITSTLEASSPLTGWKNPSSYSPSTFSAADLRFLHHFLITAYPNLPFGSEDIWQTSLPAYAHEVKTFPFSFESHCLENERVYLLTEYTQYPHLMHSILSLGASHLSRITPNGAQYVPMAITHRGKALKALGEALAKSDQCTRTELDLLLATTYALTFQSNYMEDGLVDFIVMVRGCTIITSRILNKYDGSEMFDSLTAEAVSTRVLPLLPMTTCCDEGVLDMSILTLERIQPLLRTSSQRIAYEAVLNTYRGLQRSAQDGFIALCEIYNSWELMGNQEFRSFVDPDNHVSRLLLVHYVAITVMMWPVFCTLRPSMVNTPMADLTRCQWGVAIYHSLPLAMRGLVEWQAGYIASGGSISCAIENSGHLREL